LAFVSTRDGALYIYVADRSGVRRLAPGDWPAWSPDDGRIAFNSGGSVSVMNADGSGVRHLERGGNPSWSPDASRLVFNDGNGDAILVMNADGTGVRRLLESSRVRSFSGGPCGVYWPSWSPDGRHIAFICAAYEDSWTIYLMNADGSDPRRVVSNAGSHRPIWTHGGQQLGFDWAQYRVATAHLDGSGLRTVVTNAFWADWSASGRIAFTRRTGPGPTSGGGFETRIFATTNDGSESQLVPDAVNPSAARYGDSLPSWAPGE
jgi:Tol biopolymer transport system component